MILLSLIFVASSAAATFSVCSLFPFVEELEVDEADHAFNHFNLFQDMFLMMSDHRNR